MIRKLLLKYNKMPIAVKASIWFMICGVLQKGISLLTTPIFTRILTTEQFGEFSLYQSWYAIISVFATLNLFYGALNNGMTKFSNDRKTVISSLLGLSTTITILLFIIYILFFDFWNNLFGLSTLYMVAMFLELLFAPAFNFWATSQRYDYKYKMLVFATVLMAILSPALGIIVVLNTVYKAQGRILSFVIIQVIFGLIFYIYNMSNGKKFYVKKYWKYALTLSIPLLPHYLSSIILNQSDRIMIGYMINKSAVAFYSVSYSITAIVQIVTNAINSSFTPYMYRSLKNKQYDKLKKVFEILLIFIAVVSIIAMCFGPEIVLLFASYEYYDARWIIPPVACSIFFFFLYPLFGNILLYFEKPKYIMISSCVGAVLNIILNIIFIPIFGYYAAGYTTFVCYLFYSYAHYLFSKKICEREKIKSKLFDSKKILLISIIQIIIMIFIVFVYDLIFIRYLIIFIGFIISIFLFKYMKRNDYFDFLKKNN